jgi:DNA-binding MarR family transcriptional regulator
MLQVQALVSIKKGNVSMSEIAHKFNIELPSATSLINKLYEMKLVKRYTDEKDRRLVNLSLTKKGNGMLNGLMKKKLEHAKQMLSYLSKEDKKQLFLIIQKIVKQFGKAYEK